MKRTTWHCRQVYFAVINLLAGCGGGGGGGATATVGQTPVPLTGVFFDSPVQALHYDTATQHGDTDVSGMFRYLPGETIVFSIGNIKLTSTPAKPLVTPLDVAGTTDPNDQRVTNMLVLLQSLDADGNSANGLGIAANAAALAPAGIDFNVLPATFRANAALASFAVSVTAPNRQLVSETLARQQFQNSLNAGDGAGKINIAPYANAGAMQTVSTGTQVVFNGSASGDANGDALSYQWSMVSKPAGSSAVLAGSNTAAATMVADVAGDYLAGLIVSDGTLASPISIVKVTAAGASNVPAGYALVWSDEFNATGPTLPDAGKWNYDTYKNSAGWFNGELQYYSSGRTQNSVVQDGVLRITARKENLSGLVGDWGGQAYTSARLITRGQASWTYGFFEIRAKLPCSAGTWPAIWTLGSTTDVWPDQGEIDIMEQTGWDKGTVMGTVHTLAGYGGNGSTGSTAVPDACTAFHNYQIKWTANAIDFYVDGVSYRPSYLKPANPAGWPFDNPQYLILNVAVGGALGGTVNDATLSATSMEVDYVRVYQLP